MGGWNEALREAGLETRGRGPGSNGGVDTPQPPHADKRPPARARAAPPPRLAEPLVRRTRAELAPCLDRIQPDSVGSRDRTPARPQTEKPRFAGTGRSG
jgi:hypothetical protein